MHGMKIAALTLFSLSGCGGKVPQASPNAASGPVAGDANGDGVADLSDAVALSDSEFRGGPAPTCFEAADVMNNGELDAGDITLMASAALDGNSQLIALDESVCASALEATPPQGPAAVGLGWSVERRVKGTGEPVTFEARVQLHTPERDVQAWTLSIRTEGCTVTAATTDGTAAAWVSASPPGRRGSTSVDYHALTASGGAVAGVILDWRDDRTLPARDEPYDLLALTVSASPGGGCAPCTLKLQDGGSAGGPRLRNAATIEGWTWPLEAVETTVKVCD